MTIESMTGSRPWLLAGWTMLHFLWVGGALGLVAAVGRLALRRATPEAGYGFALLCLGLMAVAPAAIAWRLSETLESPTGPAIPPAAGVTPLPRPSEVLPTAGLVAAPPELAVISRDLAREPRGRSATEGWLEAAAAGLPWLWIGGTPATFALLAAGLVGAERFRRRSRPLPDGELTAMARRLAGALGIVRPVALAVCDRLAAPILLGAVRPMVLLPSAAVTGWSPEQIEMALLHELAHVRRCDNLVNLVQRVVESLLFFHPAVWWVSGWVRREREHCCDRMVVARTGRARPYAALLAELALHGGRPGRAAVAMAESPIVSRIRCILNPEEHLMPLSRPAIVLAAVMLIAPAVLIAASRAGAPGPEARPERARIEELIRRTRHGAETFLGVQDRVYALIQIAGVQASTGDREGARRTFREAEQLAETVSLDDATYSPHILLWVARAEASHGFHDEAVAAARRLVRIAEAPSRREVQKQFFYEGLITTQRELGDREGVQESLRAARRFFETAKEPQVSTFAPSNLVKIQAASGDLAGALKMLRDPKLFPPESAASRRHQALFETMMRIKADNREGAGPLLEEGLRDIAGRGNAPTFDNIVFKNQDLETIAQAQARLGLFDEALKSARMIDTETAPTGYADFAKSDFLDQQRFHKVGALASIAIEQAKAGDRDGTRRTAEEAARIRKTFESGRWKYPIVVTTQALAIAGDLDGARALADTLDLDLRLDAYERIIAARREAGDAAGARAALEEALRLARWRVDDADAARRGQKDPDGRVLTNGPDFNRMLADLAKFQAKHGDRKPALETTRRIDEGTQRLDALKRVAAELAAAGDLDGALEAVGEMNAPQSEAEALRDVASALSQRPTAP